MLVLERKAVLEAQIDQRSLFIAIDQIVHIKANNDEDHQSMEECVILENSSLQLLSGFSSF